MLIEDGMVIQKENQEIGCGMKKRSYMEKHSEAEEIGMHQSIMFILASSKRG